MDKATLKKLQQILEGDMKLAAKILTFDGFMNHMAGKQLRDKNIKDRESLKILLEG